MCNLDDPAIIRSLRCKVIVLLLLDMIYFILSLSTLEDGGYLGIAASFLSMLATSIVVGRFIPIVPALRLLCAVCVVAPVISIAHVAISIVRAATVHSWCCRREDVKPHSVAMLLYGLCVYYGAVAVYRFVVAYGPGGAQSVRLALTCIRPAEAEVPIGEPVAESTIIGGTVPVVGGTVIASAPVIGVQLGTGTSLPTSYPTTQAQLVPVPG